MDTVTEQNTQARRIAIGITLAVILAGGGLWWYLQRPPAVAGPPASEPVAEAPVAAVTPPAILHPLDIPATAPVDGSAATPVDADALAVSGLTEVFGSGVTEWLVPEQLMRRLVATTDNLARATRTESLRPLRAPPGALLVERSPVDATVGTERITLAAANAARYNAPVALLAATDMSNAAAVYRRMYPQLQSAWEQLGYPDRYFNDRVVEVIDNLLATPEPAGPVLLEQPKVLYRFADADLESRTTGQKLLLRMGVDHARVVKAKLAEFRALIVNKE
ncbi:MAG: DUF3014 domain-containing protein [Steroidobacteraceae bacterium]